MPVVALIDYTTYSIRCKAFYGRGRKIRTLDTRFWRPLLYQLSYTPVSLTVIPQATTRFELVMKVLQTSALPLGYDATT